MPPSEAMEPSQETADGASGRQMRFLDRLTATDQRRLLDVARTTRFTPGSELMTAEDGDTDVFVIVEGNVEVILISADGRPVVYRDATAGDLVGEMSAIDGAPRSATVLARDEVKAGRLSRADLLRLIAQSSDFAVAMMRHLAAQVRVATERVFEVSTLLARERLVRELLRLADRSRPEGDTAVLSPAPTHFDLAARISTHREAVSREMSRLTRLKKVKKKGRELHILTLEGLQAEIDDV